MPLSQHQVAGHLGVSHNPKVSAPAKHASRQAILKSTSSVSRPYVAGKISVDSNPNAPKSTQHHARVSVMKTAGDLV
jgi:hypothetical protein